MSVDSKGYISQPTFKELQPIFSDTVSNVAKCLTESFSKLIHSLYIYGSIAENQAKPRISDLDMTIIFNHQPNIETIEQLDKIRAKLEKCNPIVTKIDFDCGTIQEVLNPDNQFTWGYWIKHHCICIYGVDLSECFSLFKPSRDIAIAINQDFIQVLDNYLIQIDKLTDHQKILNIQRAAARKIIRSTNILRNEEDRDWPKSLQDYYIRFKKQYPEFENDIDYLLSVSLKPTGDIENFSRRIKSFATWLDTEIKK